MLIRRQGDDLSIDVLENIFGFLLVSIGRVYDFGVPMNLNAENKDMSMLYNTIDHALH